jgi:hypothetical protein
VTTDRQAISITADNTRKSKSERGKIFNLLASLNLLEIQSMTRDGLG